MQCSIKSLLYVLLIMESTAQECGRSTEKDCARFTQYLAKDGKVSGHESGLNYCHVLVETPMNFYEANYACKHAGGHLLRLNSMRQTSELYHHAEKQGLNMSASSVGEGVWLTTCWRMVLKGQFRWAKGHAPHTFFIYAGAAMSLCGEKGHSRVCWKKHKEKTKLPFFCGLDPDWSGLEEDIHETVNDLRVTVITVMSVFMGLVVISLFIFGVAYCKRSKRKARAQKETAEGSEQRDVLPTGPPALPMDPTAAEVAQFGPEGGQPAAEGSQPAAEGGQAGAEDASSESSRSPK